MIYLDHNAITPMRPEAKAAVAAALEVFGNPSSVHAAGRAARDVLDRARERVRCRGEVRHRLGKVEHSEEIIRAAQAPVEVERAEQQR